MRTNSTWTFARRLVVCLVALSTATTGQGIGATGCVSDCTCAAGQLCSPRSGECEPVYCPTVVDPVCGMDGKTYKNSCECSAAHVVIAYPGECGIACGGVAGVPCDKGRYCEQAPGLCSPDGLGSCSNRPEGCPRKFDPVCGCDGTTYSNDCERQRAGVSKLWDHACGFGGAAEKAKSKAISCLQNSDCQSQEFCAFAEAICGRDNGRCWPKPEICLGVYLPVCGCDGNTYSNECYAHQAGVSLASQGVCPLPGK